MLLFNMASSFPLRETTCRVHVIPMSFPLSAGTTIMPVGKSKQTDSRRISQRVSKVKRKLDFVYEGDSDKVVKGEEKTYLDRNNNAQLLKKGAVIQKGIQSNAKF